MNEADAKATPTVHGYIGEYRLCWRAGYETISQRCKQTGKMVPVYFRSRIVAELHAWREKHRREQTVMVRDGAVIQAISEADAAFKLQPFVKQRGKGRAITVERKGATA